MIKVGKVLRDEIAVKLSDEYAASIEARINSERTQYFIGKQYAIKDMAMQFGIELEYTISEYELVVMAYTSGNKIYTRVLKL